MRAPPRFRVLQRGAASALAYCAQCKEGVGVFQGLTAQQRTSALSSPHSLEFALNARLAARPVCAGALLNQVRLLSAARVWMLSWMH